MKRKNPTPNLLYISVGISFWEDVRMLLPEDMSNPTAGDDFQASATHPHSERDFYERQAQLQFFKVQDQMGFWRIPDFSFFLTSNHAKPLLSMRTFLGMLPS